MTETVYPTGTCFDDVAIWLCCCTEPGDWIVCHGIVTLTEEGRPGAHAWIENGDTAIHFGMVERDGELVKAECRMPREELYRQFGVTEVTRYTPHQAAWASSALDGLSGPWRRDYRALLNNTAPKFDDRQLEIAETYGVREVLR